MLIGNRTTVVFSATTAEFGYGNFEPAPLKPPAGGGSFRRRRTDACSSSVLHAWLLDLLPLLRDSPWETAMRVRLWYR